MNGPWGTAAFAAIMAALTALFIVLGLWQLERLHEKEALIAAVAERTTLAPRSLPPLAEWIGFDSEVFDFRPVTVTGTFVPEETVLVFTSLSAPRGAQSGPGYWVVTPLALDGGGYVLVNRGFVPQNLGPNYVRRSGAAAAFGRITVTGIARKSEEASAFTPGPDTAGRIEWVRNVERIAAFFDPPLAPLAPIVIDMDAREPGALPQGGETTMSFPNNHLGYALTWFGFAMLTPILLLVWLLRRRGRRAEP